MIYFLIAVLIIWCLSFIGCLTTYIMLKVGKWTVAQQEKIELSKNVFWWICFWFVYPFSLIFKMVKKDDKAK